MCTFALNYVDDCNNIRLFCSSVWNQQTDGSAGNERDLLPCQPKVAVVYGGLWYDWGFDIGGNVCDLNIASTSLKSCRNELRYCLWDLRNSALEKPNIRTIQSCSARWVIGMYL